MSQPAPRAPGPRAAGSASTPRRCSPWCCRCSPPARCCWCGPTRRRPPSSRPPARALTTRHRGLPRRAARRRAAPARHGPAGRLAGRVAGALRQRHDVRWPCGPARSPRAGRGAGPLAVTGAGRARPRPGRRPRFGAPRQGSRRAAAPPPRPTSGSPGSAPAARHSSVLELVNPDAGPAVADVTVARPDRPGGRRPRCAGWPCSATAACGSTSAALAPRRGDLALHVVTSRGRLAAPCSTPSTSSAPAAAARTGCPRRPRPGDRQPAARPARRATGSRTLAGRQPRRERGAGAAQGRDRRARRTCPAGTSRPACPPAAPSGSRVDGAARARRRAAAALGLELAASGPVTATVRSFVDGDLSARGPGRALRGAAPPPCCRAAARQLAARRRPPVRRAPSSPAGARPGAGAAHPGRP